MRTPLPLPDERAFLKEARSSSLGLRLVRPRLATPRLNPRPPGGGAVYHFSGNQLAIKDAADIPLGGLLGALASAKNTLLSRFRPTKAPPPYRVMPASRPPAPSVPPPAAHTPAAPPAPSAPDHPGHGNLLTGGALIGGAALTAGAVHNRLQAPDAQSRPGEGSWSPLAERAGGYYGG